MAYWRKQVIKGRRFIRKNVVQKARRRYTNDRGNIRLGKVIRDVQYIKSSLNTERKHMDIKLTETKPANNNDGIQNLINGPMVATRQAPVIYKLALPVRGTAYNQRIGNQLKLTHISMRLQVERANKQGYQSTCAYKVFLFFKKDGDVEDPSTLTPPITDLIEPDANGTYTPMCYANGQTFKEFYRPKLLCKVGGFKDNVTTEAAGNVQYHYARLDQKVNIPVKFLNGSDIDCSAYRPFICLLSDDNSNATADTDHLEVTGTIRLSWVDN